MEALVPVRIFVSSPGDLANERRALRDYFGSISTRYRNEGIIIESIFWEYDIRASSGEAGQDYIFESVGEYDLYIGLMHSRFGSSGSNGKSGTEEEFEDALRRKSEKRIIRLAFFFKEYHTNVSALNGERLAELGRIREFREKVQANGLTEDFQESGDLLRRCDEILHSVVNIKKDRAAETYQPPLLINISRRQLAIDPDFSKIFLLSIDDYIAKSIGPDVDFDDLWIPVKLRDQIKEASPDDRKADYEIDDLVKDINNQQKFLIFGPEKAGRTVILKKLFRALYESGALPIYVKQSDFQGMNEDRIVRRIQSIAASQYINLNFEKSERSIVLLIDDIDQIQLHERKIVALLAKMAEWAPAIVATSGYLFNFRELSGTGDKENSRTFKRLEIRPVGALEQYQMIESWCKLRSSSVFSEENIRTEIEKRRIIIDKVFKTKLVPRTAQILLILLQAIDMGKQDSLLKSGSIRYYKFLIDMTILRDIPSDQADNAYIFLPEIAWIIFSNGGYRVDSKLINQLARKIEEERDVPIDRFLNLIASLEKTGIFERKHDQIKFKYDYVYFFFLGEYISKNLDDSIVFSAVEQMVYEAHDRRSVSTLKFLVFHTDSSSIFDLLKTSLELRSEALPPFDASSSAFEPTNQLLSDTPKYYLDPDLLAENRRQSLKAMDDRNDTDYKQDEKKDKSNAVQQIDADDDWAKVGQIMGLIEVIGDFIRSHNAKLNSDIKQQLVLLCSRSTQKFSGFVYNKVQGEIGYLIEIMRNFDDRISAKRRVSDQEKEIRKILFFLMSTIYLQMNAHAASAVSDENLSITLKKISDTERSVGHLLFDFLIKIESFAAFPLEELKELKRLSPGNHVITKVIQISVARRLELRPITSHDELQRVCAAAEINVKKVMVSRLGGDRLH